MAFYKPRRGDFSNALGYSIMKVWKCADLQHDECVQKGIYWGYGQDSVYPRTQILSVAYLLKLLIENEKMNNSLFRVLHPTALLMPPKGVQKRTNDG